MLMSRAVCCSPLLIVRWLRLQNNQLAGAFTPIAPLTQLTGLQLGNNQFSGPLDPLTSLGRLQYVTPALPRSLSLSLSLFPRSRLLAVVRMVQLIMTWGEWFMLCARLLDAGMNPFGVAATIPTAIGSMTALS